MNGTNPAEFEAYLRRFRNGVFSELSQARLAVLCTPASSPTVRAVQEPLRMRRGLQESAC